MGKETLEPHEMIEETAEGRRRLTTRVALTAAILAVLASVSALQAERTAAEGVVQKNDAVLWQSRASDEWAYRQAKSIKLHIQELAPGRAPESDAERAEIAASEARAKTAEERRDAANERSAESFEQHHRFSIGTSLLQIAIVLETVAAVLDRTGLWAGGLAVGALGAAALLNGFLGFF